MRFHGGSTNAKLLRNPPDTFFGCNGREHSQLPIAQQVQALWKDLTVSKFL